MKMNARGQITIPKDLFEQYGLKPGDEVELVPLEDGIRIQKRVHPIRSIRGILTPGDGQTVDEYIDEIRG